MAIFATVIGAPGAIATLRRAEGLIMGAGERGMARAVLQGQGIVRGKASGRPGPRVITGDFRRSIVGQSARAGAVVVGQIGTNAAQALRLEFGFSGPDRLGRVYDQPPYPYMQPAIPEVERVASAEISSAIGRALG